MSNVRRIGLPQTLRMRHDQHFVDRLARQAGAPIGQLVPLEEIRANPDQPRRDVGDLTELIASIREKGILEPLLVRPRGQGYEVVAGERRYRAAIEVGLDEVPCIVREATDAEVMELALIENLQRKDLSALEEADGLAVLRDTFRYTHEEMAQRLGKSRSSLTEALSLASIPGVVREACRRADISSKSLLLQVVRRADTEKMLALVDQLASGSKTRDEARRLAKAPARRRPGRPKNFVFKFQPPSSPVRLSLQFKKADASKQDVIEALETILTDLKKSV